MAANKPWETGPRGRKTEGAQQRRRVLIVCEDSKSSCLYFRSFKIDTQRAEVLAVGKGMNTDSLVEEAIRLKHQRETDRRPYHEIWCVLDRDSFPESNYARAFTLAEERNIQMAWANEAFELWYLLHFNYHDTGISRKDYQKRLDARLPQSYDKADPSVYENVLPQQATAIRNARRLEKHWRDLGERFPERKNPSTSIHKLVEFLNELRDLGPV
jgi:hypothetical protein